MSKICFIMNNIFTLGGVQRVASVLASELSKEHEISILCISKEHEINHALYNLDAKVNVEFNSTLDKTNILSKSLRKIIKDINKKTGILNKEKYYEKLCNIYFPGKVKRNFTKYLNDKQYDIVIGVEGLFSILLGSIKENLNSKVLGWQHNSYDAYLKNPNRYYWNLDILFDKYITQLDKYIVLTDNDKITFKKQKNIESTVIYNPRSFSSNEKSDVSKKQFLAAGRFNYQKGFDLLIESFYEFSKKNNDWNLVIVGEGEEKSKILEKINKYNLDNRISVENFTDNIKKYFLESSVLLLPSRWEGMPMIVLESLEMGVPIISYDITAVESLVTNGKEGLIIDKFHTKLFAEAMWKVSESYDMRCELSKNAIRKSKKFEIGNIIGQWSKLFLTLK